MLYEIIIELAVFVCRQVGEVLFFHKGYGFGGVVEVFAVDINLEIDACGIENRRHVGRVVEIFMVGIEVWTSVGSVLYPAFLPAGLSARCRVSVDVSAGSIVFVVDVFSHESEHALAGHVGVGIVDVERDCAVLVSDFLAPCAFIIAGIVEIITGADVTERQSLVRCICAVGCIVVNRILFSLVTVLSQI